ADSIGQNQHLGDRPLPRLAGFAEAEVLSTALNELVERQREHNNTLQELNASLDQRVRDRTAALNLALQGEALNLQRMQNIANSVPAQIAHFDADGHCLFANQAALRLAGLPPERSGMLRLVDLLGDPVPPALLPMASSATTLPQTLRVQHARVVGDDTWHSEVHWLPDGEHGVGAAGGRPGHYLVSFDVSQLKEVELRLQQLSRADALTGLPNRRQFDEHMRASLARERRTGRGLGVVYLDLDHFKRINDTLGHAGGDEVLKTFAQRVGSVIRATDLLARVGGDEFVLVCEGVANPEQMQVLADKVLTAVRAPLRLQNQQVLLSTSMGSALMQDGESVDHLLARADA
ncbi:sensor domain-containing diguanylate cyclase, partial [Ideonella azotifigens]